MIPLALLLLGIGVERAGSRSLPPPPAYAEIVVPPQATSGRAFEVRIHLRTVEGGAHRARPTERLRLWIEGETESAREISARSFRNGAARTQMRIDSPGFHRLLLRAGTEEGEREIGRSLLVRVTEDPLARARGLLLVSTARARAGEPLSVRAVVVDDAGAPVEGLALPRFDWSLETEGVSVRILSFDALDFQLIPLEEGALRVRLTEGITGLSGLSDTVAVEAARLAAWRVEMPPVFRAGEPVLVRILAEGPRGARASLPEGKEVILRGARAIPDRLGAENFARGEARAWVVFPDPGEVRVRAVTADRTAAPGVHAIHRVGRSAFRLIADAPADSLLLHATAEEVRLVWPEGVWRGEGERIDLGGAIWRVENPGPPLVLGLTGIGASRRVEGRPDRNTFRLDILEALGEDAPESGWGELIRSGRFAEARARISSHLASHPEDTEAAEVMERLERMERIFAEPR